MAVPCVILKRYIATSSICHGAHNFRMFDLYNKRGSRAFKERRRFVQDPDLPIDKRGCKDTGFMENGKYVHVPERVPELIVPDLTNFKLKPYVCYKSESFIQRPFTAHDLFDALYAPKIRDDFINNKLGPDGEPLEPSENEKLTPQQAKDNAGRTGCDLFCQPRPRTKLD